MRLIRYIRLATALLLILVSLSETSGSSSSSSSHEQRHEGGNDNENHIHSSRSAKSSRQSEKPSHLRATLQAKANRYNEQRQRQRHLSNNNNVISSDHVRRTPITNTAADAVKATSLYEFPFDIITPDLTQFGGISGITYNPELDVYYVVTDDIAPFRLKTPAPTRGPTSAPTAVPAPTFVYDPDYHWGQPPSAAPSLAPSDAPSQAPIVPTVSNAPSVSSVPSSAPTEEPRIDHSPRFYTISFQHGLATVVGVTRLRKEVPQTQPPQTQPPTQNPSNTLGDVSGGDDGDIVVDVTRQNEDEGLHQQQGGGGGVTYRYYEAGEAVPQAIAYSNDRLYIAYYNANEANDNTGRIAEFDLAGRFVASFTLPSYFRFRNNVNHQGNAGFTALSVNPKENKLWAATGVGLLDDNNNDIRVIQLDLTTRTSEAQYVYPTTHTVVGMVNIDENGGFLVLEQQSPVNSISGNTTVTLNYARCFDAINVKTVSDLRGLTLKTMRKETLQTWPNTFAFDALSVSGGDPNRKKRKNSKSRSTKKHPHGDHERQLNDHDHNHEDDVKSLDLILMSDNDLVNDRPSFALFVELQYRETPLLEPQEETADTEGLLSIASDPAIWVHPHHPEQSLILGALLEGGLAVYDLSGTLKQSIGADATAVDVLYAFQKRPNNLFDIAIVTDNQNGLVRVYKIDYDEGQNNGNYLTDVTDGDLAGIQMAQQLAAYTSPYTNKYYMFVVSGGRNVVQVELTPRLDGDGDHIMGTIVRTITLPNNAGGMVVDQELGYLYVSIQSGNGGILKYDAEPNEYNDQGNPKTVVAGDEPFFEGGQLTGLTLYYGLRGEGYLVVSVSGDSTFVVVGREEDNSYYDSFSLGQNEPDGIDRVDGTQGIDIINVYLGPEFKCGLFVAQDHDNEEARINGADQGELVNSNTNFKIVPYEELAEKLYYYLDIEPNNWGPRKFALTNLVDLLARDVYKAFTEGELSGRDAETLLYNLNSASSELYKPTTKKHQMISVVNPWEYSYRRSLEERREETRRRLKADSINSSSTSHEKRQLSGCSRRRHLGYIYEDAKYYLQAFIDHIQSLEDKSRLSSISDARYVAWLDLPEAIKGHLPY